MAGPDSAPHTPPVPTATLPAGAVVSVLGPQRPKPVLADTLAALGIQGSVAVITAGWRHEEDELGALLRDLGARDLNVVHLPLYTWFDRILRREPVLEQDYRARQREIVAWKAGHREQLTFAMQSVRRMEERAAREPARFADDLRWTLGALHALDRRVIERLDAIRAAYPICARPWDFPRVRDRHAHVKDVLAHVDAVLIAGGHVGVLRNRMEFFGVDVLLRRYLRGGGRLVAWSAGAMVLGDRIFLYYDDPPEGTADAELFDRGFGIVPGTVFLPHAHRRLRFGDEARMARFARRLAPDLAITIENGARLDHVDGVWHDRSRPGSLGRLCVDGPPGGCDATALPAPDVGERP